MTVVSAVWLAATRCSASATRFRARRRASPRASSSAWRTERASSWRIRSSERSTQELEERLAERGVAPRERERALATLASSGLVDDERFARARAEALAARGSGDALIRDDLERRGVATDAVEHALAALEPERERAAALVARRGPGPRTARYLAARGFDEDAVAEAVAPEAADALE